MKSIIKTIFFILLPIFSTNGQVSISGQILNTKKEKIVGSIYQDNTIIADNFYGDFKISIDSLGEIYTFKALGYDSKEVTIVDTNFLFITLQITKPKRNRKLRSIRRNRKSNRKMRRLSRSGKVTIHGGCCFVSDTRILMADGTEKNIENIIVSDTIRTYDFSTENSLLSIVYDMDTVIHQNIIEIELENKTKIKNTIDHPYYVFGKGICSYDPKKTFENYGIKTKQLQINDYCYSYRSGELVLVQIIHIMKVTGTFITYNISELDNNNNYFVNGILVNNEKVKNKKVEHKISSSKN